MDGAAPMFQLNVSGPTGVEAEFTVPSATLALDLALRSERAGCLWRLEHHVEAVASPLTLTQLRALAMDQADNDDERLLIDQIEWQHELQTSFQLN